MCHQGTHQERTMSVSVSAVVKKANTIQYIIHFTCKRAVTQWTYIRTQKKSEMSPQYKRFICTHYDGFKKKAYIVYNGEGHILNGTF